MLFSSKIGNFIFHDFRGQPQKALKINFHDGINQTVFQFTILKKITLAIK